MHIKAKLYPYPVLAPFNTDYLDSSFDISIDDEKSEKEITLKFYPELINDELSELIASGEALFVVHIECSYTSFRRIVQVPVGGASISVSANQIAEVLNICPFIVAAGDLFGYSNKNFNPEYDGASFDLEKGSIMAIGIEKAYRIEKEDDEVANIPSIFSVTEILDRQQTDIIIDYTGDKIGIRLPSDVYRKFVTQNSNNPNAQPVLHAMLIIPALIKCLEDVKHSGADYYQYEERRWFRSIQKAAKKINFEVNENTISSIDTFELAEKLMHNTTSNGIKNLNKVAVEGGFGSED